MGLLGNRTLMGLLGTERSTVGLNFRNSTVIEEMWSNTGSNHLTAKKVLIVVCDMELDAVTTPL